LKNTPALGLSALFALAITCGAAQAQTLNATLTSSGTQSLSAGSDFSNGGEITVTASGVASGATVTINSVTLSVGNSAVFDTLTLSGSSPGGSSDASVGLTSGSNVASFSSIVLSNGQSATFTLNGTVSSTPPATNSFGRREFRNLRLASMFAPGPAGGATMISLGLLTLALLAIGGRLRRRHLIMFAVWAVMAAAVAGCGNGSSASSDQQVTAISATSSTGSTVTVTGPTIDMGTITVESNQSSTGVAAPTPTP